MSLKELLGSGSYDAAFDLAVIKDPNTKMMFVGDTAIEVSEKLRQLAIAVWVVKKSEDGFFRNLSFSGMVRLKYLERCLKENALEDHHRGSGRVEALVDTIAAGHWELAEKIVATSPENFLHGHEYEDDYCFAQILNKFILEKNEQIPTLFKRWLVYDDKKPSPRYEVLEALYKKDNAKFEGTLKVFMETYRKQVKKDWQEARLGEDELLAKEKICVEALAFLRLAKKRGLKPRVSYKEIPTALLKEPKPMPEKFKKLLE